MRVPTRWSSRPSSTGFGVSGFGFATATDFAKMSEKPGPICAVSTGLGWLLLASATSSRPGRRREAFDDGSALRALAKDSPAVADARSGAGISVPLSAEAKRVLSLGIVPKFTA